MILRYPNLVLTHWRVNYDPESFKVPSIHNDSQAFGMSEPTVIAQLSSERPRTKDLIDPSYPLLEANRGKIEATRRCTFDYGPHERHKLDVYYPPCEGPTEGMRYPTLVFFYGGGLVRGSRSSAPSHLVHNNLGAFFSSRGILTIIPDYRLAPGISFPDGSEDTRDALQWIKEHVKEHDPERVFILAHSAGGLHVAGLMLKPDIFATFSQDVCGVIYTGVSFAVTPSRREFYQNALEYYGGAQGVKTNMPIPLLRRADELYIAGLPPIWNMVAGSEPKPIVAAARDFSRELARKGGTIEEFVMEGHDHLSPILALSSGYGEEWAEKIVDWVKGRVLERPQCVQDDTLFTD